MASRRLPFLVGIGVSIAALCLWQGLEALKSDRIQQKIDLEAKSIKIELTGEMKERFLALVRMTKRWENAGKPSQQNWKQMQR
ncbi:hypothetical protein NC997_26100 [Trichocoleus sp. DQ-A2]|uniref:hypothetical protein n=1 Tax=Trichocoleus sp. DQ-A2 TaxID=2933924 RepID=UPI003299ACD8